mgnify:CR=1 FL=1
MSVRVTSGIEGRCRLCTARSKAFCSVSDPVLCAEVMALSQTRIVPAGTTVVHEDDEAVLVGSIIRGALCIKKNEADGRQHVVGLLLPGDTFGRPFTATAQFAIEAASESVLCCFNRASLEKLILRNPALEHQMYLSVLDQLDQTRQWILLRGCHRVPQRVASFLLFLCRDEPAPHPASRIVTIPLNRKDLAAFLGTTVETVSRILQSLARRQIIRIHTPKRLEILDRHRLFELTRAEETEAGQKDQPEYAAASLSM